MRKLNFKIWLIVFILIAGVSWSVMPKFRPSLDFGPKPKEEKAVEVTRENSKTTSQPVGQSNEEKSIETFSSEDKASSTNDVKDSIQGKSKSNITIRKTSKAKKRFKASDSGRISNSKNAKNTSSSSGTSSGASPQGNVIVGGASTPKEIKVSETGEGDTMLLREALRLLQPGGSVFLQKGYYKLHIGDMRIPDSTFRGEGKESILELNDTFKVATSNLKLQNLKIIHYGTDEALAVLDGKKLSLEKVILQSNANNGIAISNSHFEANDLEIQGAQHAFLIKDVVTFEAKNIKLSDVDYGIYFDSNKDLTMTDLKIKNSNVLPIHFVNDGKGKLTCVKCSFDKKPSNNPQRLILKK
jgi:hypothetical protein